MPLVETEPLRRGRALHDVVERVKALVDLGLHAGVQRMAGMAFLIRVGSAGIVFLSQIFLARWMGAGEFGAYVYTFTCLLLIGDIIHLGMPVTVQRYLPKYSQRNEHSLLRGFLTASRWITFGMGTSAALIGAVLLHAFRDYFDPNVVGPLFFVCVALPFYTLSNTLDGIARTYNWMTIALVPPYILRPLILIALMVAAHKANFAMSALNASIALAIACWTAALLQLLILQRRLAQTIAKGPKAFELKAWMTTTIPIILVGAFYTSLTYTDVVVLKQFRSSEEVAVYFAASKTLMLVAFIYFSVAASVGHHFTIYQVNGDRDGLEVFLAKAVNWTFWPSLGATLLVLALGKPILWLFGPEFITGYPVMFILAVGLLARASVGPAERLLNMMGEQRRCALAYAGAFGFNLAGCLILAPPFGGIGVAVATASALIVESVLLSLIARQRLRLHVFVWKTRGVTGR